jgi:hypothetical protein
MGMELGSLRLFQNILLRRLFGPKIEAVTEGKRVMVHIMRNVITCVLFTYLLTHSFTHSMVQDIL